MKVDFANLKRVIERGAAEAAQEAGIENVVVRVTFHELPRDPATPVIAVELVVLTTEQAADLIAATEAEQRKRDADN